MTHTVAQYNFLYFYIVSREWDQYKFSFGTMTFPKRNKYWKGSEHSKRSIKNPRLERQSSGLHLLQPAKGQVCSLVRIPSPLSAYRFLLFATVLSLASSECTLYVAECQASELQTSGRQEGTTAGRGLGVQHVHMHAGADADADVLLCFEIRFNPGRWFVPWGRVRIDWFRSVRRFHLPRWGNIYFYCWCFSPLNAPTRIHRQCCVMPVAAAVAVASNWNQCEEEKKSPNVITQ